MVVDYDCGLWFIIGVHAGFMAAGFGFAGVCQFQEFEKRKRLHYAAAIDPTGIALALVAIGSVLENWRHVRAGRRFIYASLASTVVMFAALVFRN